MQFEPTHPYSKSPITSPSAKSSTQKPAHHSPHPKQHSRMPKHPPIGTCKSARQLLLIHLKRLSFLPPFFLLINRSINSGRNQARSLIRLASCARALSRVCGVSWSEIPRVHAHVIRIEFLQDRSRVWFRIVLKNNINLKFTQCRKLWQKVIGV